MLDRTANLWTRQDETKLQQLVERVEYWRSLLAKSEAATVMREGPKARTEYRWLIANAESAIAALRARKSIAAEAA